jgi:hypothetical protein
MILKVFDGQSHAKRISDGAPDSIDALEVGEQVRLRTCGEAKLDA